MEELNSTVDTSRPFRSVKEAVAIFGERLLVGEVYSPKPLSYEPYKKESPRNNSLPICPIKAKDQDKENITALDTLKKLEAELEETKAELRLLKEREMDKEVTLAYLNAELHKNRSKLAEAAVAKKSVASGRSLVGYREGEAGVREEEAEERKRQFRTRTEDSPTLAEILSIGEKGGYFCKKEGKLMKKKPIVPLIGDLFCRKKGSSTVNHSLYSYSSSQLFN